ncbi:WhiB family transcriptional regulator [Saccharopolyspora sp. K220]|uniref:WhiB family transcriptional regulator n=1 Tax=Saccharopolyspora soli TaxID=2926618 RepID=UPI001F5867A2|nr:WhiB family transcriptional regulator [Saccharopolyspora soli]MCI2423974.1 WhiB family transcriptional regulator [Saccharopolyspora soli]
MTSQERLDRADALYVLLTRLPGAEFGAALECAETDPEVFFPEPGQTHLVVKAKAICAVCPVIDSCREVAIRRGEHGIWGGTTESERRTIRQWRRLAAVEGDANEVAAAAERALAAIERVSGAPVPGLRRHVADVLRWADDNGDSDADRASAVLAVLRPEIEHLAVLDDRAGVAA